MKPHRSPKHLLIIGLTCANILVIALSTYSLLNSRKQYDLRAETQTQNIANALDQSLSSSIAKLDLALRLVAEELERQLTGGAIDELTMNAFLARMEQRVPEAEAFRVSKADGLVILGKGVKAQDHVSWADRDYFIYHRNNDAKAIKISKPVMGRVSKKYIVGLAQRYNFPDGRFAGVISAPITVDYFTRVLSKFYLNKTDAMSLRYSDLSLITRMPTIPDQPAGQIGNSAVSPELRKLVMSGIGSATYYTPAWADGIERVVTFHRLEMAPLIIIVGVARDDYLGGWFSELHQMAAMMAGFLLLSLLLGAVLLRMFSQAISRELRLAQSEDRLRDILATLPDAVYVVDFSGAVTYMNPEAERLLGWNLAEAFGKDSHGLFHGVRPDGGTYPIEECPIHRAVVSGRRQALLMDYVVPRDGSFLPVQIAANPLEHAGQSQGAVVAFSDMTERLGMEKALREAKDAAEIANRAKSAFLAMMSHEVRTPITGVLGMADLLRRTPLNEEQVGYLDTLAASTKTLLTILNDILDISKIEAGKVVLEAVEFALLDAVRETTALFVGLANAKGVSLASSFSDDLPRSVIGDPVRFRQLLFNLTSNAIKFTERGGVELRLSLASHEGDVMTIKVEVEDSGIGIAREQLPLLFKPFSQLGQTVAYRSGGTGLGLVITKRLLEMMGGAIGVESEVGNGTCFWFTLPIRMVSGPAKPARHEDRLPQPSALRSMRILLAEDNTINQMLISTMLQKMGHTVVVADNGRIAVWAIESGDFDAVLMDMQMPEMDGEEATRAIRSMPSPKSSIAIIALTADAMVEHRERYLAAGVNDLVPKPIDWDVLLTALDVQGQSCHASLHGGRIK